MERITVLLELTRKCNLLCKHCYNSSCIDSPLQLTLEEIKVLIGDIKKIQKKYPIERIILTGGEFITMDNSLEIFKLFKENFECILRIETNGFMFYKNPKLINLYDADEFFISVDKLHGTLNDDGSSNILDFFLKNTNNNIVARITIEQGDEQLRDSFISRYRENDNLVIEAKYISPSGRASKNFEKFKGYKFSENPELFKCLAKNYIHFNVSRNWYCCYTACELSHFAKLGDDDLIDKFESRHLSKDMRGIRENGIAELLKNNNNRLDFENKKFYYRCEPCLYLQKLNSKKIILVDLPAVDTAQDVYTKGFIFPTFTEKYLKKMLEYSDVEVYYYNLNKCNIKEAIKEINDLNFPVYIHLIANKLYSYNLFKKTIKNQILVGGPLPKFKRDYFNDVIVIEHELEEEGILKFLKLKTKNIWSNPVFCPNSLENNFVNQSVQNDFSNIILLSRGCVYNCSFCLHACYHKKLHVRDIQSVELELNNYKNKKTSVYIADATIGNLKTYGPILKLLTKYKNLSFSMNVRADQINDEFIKIIEKINIDKLYIGVEDIDDKMLKFYNKCETIAQISNALEILKRKNIKYHLSFILSENINIEKIKEIDNCFQAETYSFHFYIPYPGTYGSGDIDVFNERDWPYQVSVKLNNATELVNQVSGYFNYPINKYHTITPHDHNETFRSINQKLDELEQVVYEKH